jgi:membrane protein YqaA with SNARE-associated domain
MILLSVITALSLSNKIQENTLGTLLGGIAGYVLAQGIGRAAARAEAAKRERADLPPKRPGE